VYKKKKESINTSSTYVYKNSYRKNVLKESITVHRI